MYINSRFLVLEGLSGCGKTTQARRLVERLTEAGIPTVINTEPTKGNPMPFGRLIRQIIEGQPLDQEKVDVCDEAMLQLAQDLGGALGDGGRRLRDIAGKLRIMSQRRDGTSLLSELELQILFLIDRRFDLIHTIIPQTERGTIVVQDRYELSTLTYGASRGLFVPDLWYLQTVIAGPFYRAPVATVVFKVKPETAAQRLQTSGKPLDRFEVEVESLRKIDREYARLAEFLRERHLSCARMRNEHLRGVVFIDAERPEDEVFNELWKLASGLFLG